MLVRLYDPDEGAVRLDGIDLRDLTLEAVRANVGTLLQEQLLFDATVRENVAYGRSHATEEELLAVAHATGLDELVAALPRGYDTPVGQRGRALWGGPSGSALGWREGFCATRPSSYWTSPSPASNDAGARLLLPALHASRHRRTTILISHHPIAAELADRTVEAADGRLHTPVPIAVPA